MQQFETPEEIEACLNQHFPELALQVPSFVAHGQLRELLFAERVTQQEIPEHFVWFVLYGRVRFVQEQQTLFVLKAGDMLEPEHWPQTAVCIASDDTAIWEAPARFYKKPKKKASETIPDVKDPVIRPVPEKAETFYEDSLLENHLLEAVAETNSQLGTRTITPKKDPARPGSAMSSFKSSSGTTSVPSKILTTGWYISLLAKNGLITLQLLGASVLIQIFTLGMPIFYMVIFDRVFGRQNLNTLDVLGMGMALVLVFDLFVKGLRSLILTQLLVWVDKISLKSLLDKVFSWSLPELKRSRIRIICDRFGDLPKINENLLMLIAVHTLDVVFSVAMGIFLFFLHPLMALVALSPLLPLLCLTLLTAGGMKRRSEKLNRLQQQYKSTLSDTIDRWETVQSFSRPGQLKERLLHQISQGLEETYWSRFDSVSGANLSGFISNVGALATLYFGAHEVLQGRVSFGAYAAINMMSRNIIGSIQKFGWTWHQFQENVMKLDQLQEALSSQSFEGTAMGRSLERPDRPYLELPDVKGQLSINHVTFRYPASQEGYPKRQDRRQQERNRKTNRNHEDDTVLSGLAPHVLHQLSLKLDAGEKVVLTGVAGAGKTTLIRLIQGLYVPESGNLFLDGFPMSELDPMQRRQLVGVAIQKPSFFPGSLLENLLMGENWETPMASVLTAVSRCQLQAVVDKLPKGLDTPLGEFAGHLTPEVAAKISLCRALIKQPAILVVDQILDGLEATTQSVIYTQLIQQLPKTTCIFISNTLPLHQQVNRILVLREGHIVEEGSFNTLIQKQGFYYHLHVLNRSFTVREAQPT